MDKQIIGDYTHIWTRNSHQVWYDNTLVFSNQKVPCPNDPHCTVVDDHHKTHFYHYGKKTTDGLPLFFDPFSGFIYASKHIHCHTDRIICKYERNSCWERYNANHIQKYHHTK